MRTNNRIGKRARILTDKRIGVYGGLRSCTESVDGSALALKSVDNIHGGDGLSPGVFGVGDSVSDDALKEALEHLPTVVVDEGADPLDATSPGESADGGLGDALDGCSGVALGGSPLGADLALSSNSFASLSLSWHSSN